MPTVADIIRAPKSGLDYGKWQTGKLPTSLFPIQRAKRLSMGPSWSWRLVQFTALGYPCRVLIRVNVEKSYYTAMLGLQDGSMFRVVCHHDFHLGDKNWHCHFSRGDVRDTFPHVLRDHERYRVYEAEPSKAEQAEFNVTLKNALTVAAERYRFGNEGRLL